MLLVVTTFRTAPARAPAYAAEAMVATSQPLATRAGLRILERDGNAVDAAIAAAAVLSVTEPMSTGIGGDACALVWRDGGVVGLDAAGPAPLGADPEAPVAERGPRSVTVPGAVAGWAAAAERFGRLGLDTLLADAVDAAERGFTVGTRTAALWSLSEAPSELGPPPSAGQQVRLPDLGATLRRIAEEGPPAFYGGDVAAAITAASWLEPEDLDAFRPHWVEPLSVEYRGTTVFELPPPTQGVAALEGLGLLALGQPDLRSQVGCIQLALEDAFLSVRDGADVSGLLDEQRLAARRRERPGLVQEPAGGTVYLCAVDGERTAVSFIQSLFYGFGSGLVAPGTGVVLQNRGACFAVSGHVEPGRRPYHTIIPGLLVRDGSLLGPFGVMGGFLQAQAHLQLVSALVDDELDPQAALDRPRFRVDGDALLVETPLADRADELDGLGLDLVVSDDVDNFGAGHAILVDGDALAGGADARKDGYAAGF